MKERPFRYKAFLSYSHRDAKWGAWLHRAIESYRIPAHLVEQHQLSRRSLRPVFRDRDELATSSDLTDTISSALESSEYLIVICSSHSMDSQWVGKEIETFISLGRQDNILCFALEEFSACRPPALSHLETLAADARREGDGRRAAKLKIISGLLNIRYDEIVRRDNARRQRRLAIVATAAVAGMLVMTGLAGYAYLQREEANEQRAAAAREAATLEQVVDFMMSVFDASNPEIAMGNDPTASELLRIGVERIDESLQDEPAVRARLLSTLGQVHWRRNELEVADSLIAQSLEIKRAVAVTPEDEVLRDILLLALVRHETGEFEEAEGLYVEALEGKRRLHGPDHRDSMIALANLGTLYHDMGRLDEALETSTEVLELKRRNLGDSDPSTLTSVMNMASLLGAMHRYDEARELLEQSRDVVRRDVGLNHPLTLGIEENLAIVIGMQGNLEEEIVLLLDIIDRKTSVYGEFHVETQLMKRNLGVVYRDLERLDDAERVLTETLEYFRGSYGDAHLDTLRNRSHLAAVWALRGDHDLVVSELPVVLGEYEAQIGDENPYVIDVLAELGNSLIALGREEEGRQQLNRALELATRVYGEADIQVQAIEERLGEIGEDE